MLAKTLLVDLLKLDNPTRLGDGDGWGTGDPFSFGLSVGRDPGAAAQRRPDDRQRQQLPRQRGPAPGTPDDTEMIIIDPDATIAATESDAT